MDEIIYLEPDEEITSIIDKLKALNPELKAVSLVIPKNAGILQSVVNLKLLKKEGESLKKDLSVITQDRIGRNLASQAGFTVYDNIHAEKPIIEPPRPQPKTEEIIELDLTNKKEDEEKAPGGIAVHRYDNSYQRQSKPIVNTKPISSMLERSAEPIREKPATIKPISNHDFSSYKKENTSDTGSKKKKIIFTVFGILLITAVILFYILYPSATVTLAVKSEVLDAPIEVTVDNNINIPDESRAAIPGELLEAEQQGGKKFSATGKKEIGEKAKGTITVSNETGDAQKITSGVEFKSDSGLVYRATSDASVPGATASVDSHGNVVKNPGKSDVSVEASEPGDKYNIGPSVFTVSGRSMLSGKNSNPMSGGVSRTVAIVTQNDLNNAKNELSDSIKTALREELKKQAKENKIYDSSIKDEIISSESDKKAGDEADTFEMKVKVKSSVISFNENSYREIVVKLLGKSVPSDKTLSLSPQDEINITSAKTDTSTGLLTLSGNVKTHTISKIDENKIKSSIKGKNRPDAENLLKEFKDVESVNIVFNPSWLVKKVPNQDNNIKIKFEYK